MVLEFSKYVERRSVEESIFFSPSVGHVELEWSGREVEVRFGEPLRENVTYVITLGTDVVDVRNKNRMAAAFTLAFSTGAVLDSAAVRGRVFDAKPAGVTIFAYRLDGHSPDTLNPARVKPDYVTQTGVDGSFRLDHMAWGQYRLFAVRDAYKNLLYVPQVDHIGMSTADVLLDRRIRLVEDIFFRLTREDTSRPFVLGAEAISNQLVRVRFSEPIDEASLHEAQISIVDTISNLGLGIHQFFVLANTPSAIHIFTELQDSATTYRATLGSIRDTVGNLINPNPQSALFQGGAKADTLPPRMLSVSIADSALNILPDATIGFVFSEAVVEQKFESGFRLLDSVRNVVQGEFIWPNPNAVRFRPHEPFRSRAWYRIEVQLDSVQDFGGNRLRDTMFVRSFRTIEIRSFGGILGRVVDANEADRSPIFVTAVSVSDKEFPPRTRKLDGPGEFTFDDLTEGEYVLDAFRDADGNAKYSYGRPFPFSPAERFAFYPDTLKVRARWPLEGIVLELKAR